MLRKDFYESGNYKFYHKEGTIYPVIPKVFETARFFLEHYENNSLAEIGNEKVLVMSVTYERVGDKGDRMIQIEVQ